MQRRKHKRARRSGAGWRRALFEPLEARLPLAADIATGLAHHWTFDETSGDTAADSAGASAGTLVGWGASEPKWIAGRVGGALRFDTSDNYVVATPPAMSGSYAVSFWLNMKDRSGVGPRILSVRAGSQIVVNFYDGRGVSFYSPPSRDAIADPDPPTFNTWEHYAINFNVATGQGVIYRRGAPVAIGTYNDSTSLANWIIGHHEDLGNSVDSIRGALDDLRVYDRLLADEDIAALASLGVPEPTHLDPVHHWTFDETTGFTAHDAVGDADGVLLNWNQTEPRWEAGIVGGALRLSTADNAVVTPAIATGAVWTTAFWLNVQSRTGINPRVLEPWAYINLENNRGVGFTSRNQHTFDSTPVTLDKWEHYAITYDTINNVGTIYRNGVAVKSGPYLDNAPASSWVFGHQSGDLGNHNDSLDGLLDDFRQYDRLLSPSEIQALAGQANPQPPTAGLIHHWTFDETIGDIAADIVGSNEGELRNFSATQQTWVPGKIGNAVRFSEGNDLILTESAITYDQYTMSFWLNQTGEGGFNPRIVGIRDSLEEWIVIAQTANKGICMGPCDPQLPKRGVWEHYALTFDQPTDQVNIYRNGALVASGSFLRPSPLAQWIFGHNADLNRHVDTFNGMLDDFRVYNRLLTASEVQLIANYQPLEARADEYATREDSVLFVSGPLGVMSNDSTAGAGTRAVVDSLPTRGQLTLTDDGSFTYSPGKDFNGTDSFTYHLEFGTEASQLTTVTISVTPVNDAPSFLVGADRFVDDESGSRAIHHWASQVSAGPPDEAGQSLTFSAVADKPELLAVQPQIELVDGTFGRLTYTLARNKIGVVTVTVTVQDSGGTADGGIETSPAQTFKINIAKKNPGHNAVNARDVTNDGMVGASDALAIINFINAYGIGPVPAANVNAPPYYDVVPDDVVSSSDALEIINYINANPRGSVDFLGTDATTQGEWVGKYGTEGYSINSGAKSQPLYVALSFSNLYNVVWDDSTTDERALELPDGSGRLASAWTGNNPENPDQLNGMIFHLSLTDGQFHRVTIYALDWDTHNRRQKIEILDATTDEILDTRLAEPFSDGLYYSWMLQGGVKIRFTNLANGLNTVASGIFFD